MTWKPCANTVLPCPYDIESGHTCRFEDDTPLHKETLLCPVCCPNCYGGTGQGPTHELIQQGIMKLRKEPPSE